MGRRLRSSPASCTALDSPGRGRLLHLGPHEQRGRVPLPALRPRASARTTCPTARTCATSRAASALGETIGIGKGTVSLDDFDQADADLRRRPEPGHQPPAHALRPGGGEAARRDDRRVNPLPEAGLMRFKNPQNAAALLGRGTASPTSSCQVRIGGDQALFHAIVKPLLDAERERPATCSTTPSSPSTPRASTAYAATAAPSTGTRSLARDRPRPASEIDEAGPALRRPRARRSSAGRWA